MKDIIKRHVISLGITFLASFFLVVSFAVMSDQFTFSVAAIKSIAIAGLIAGSRAVAKIVYELCYNYLSNKRSK